MAMKYYIALAILLPVIAGVSFPYFDNFETPNGLWETSYDTNLTPGWVLGNPNKTIIKGTTSGVNAWVTRSLYTNYLNNEFSYLTSPAINFTGVTSKSYVSFQIWYETGALVDGVNFQYTIDNGSNWSTLGDTGDEINWYNGYVDSLFDNGWSGHSGGYNLSTYLLGSDVNGKQEVRFRFEFASSLSENTYNGIAIDDFSVKPVTTYLPLICPLSYTVNGTNPVTITWKRDPRNSPLLPYGYNVYLGTSKLSANLNLVSTTNETSFNSSLLEVGTTYYYQVVPYGDVTDLLPNCTVLSFATPTEQVKSFPYFENFEHGPGGWQASAGSSWVLGNPEKATIRGSYSGNNSWVTSLYKPYPPSEASFVYSPIIDLTSVTTDPVVSFRIWWDTYELNDGSQLEVIYDKWTTVGASYDTLNTTNNWYNIEMVEALAFLAPQPSEGWSGVSSGYVLATHVVSGAAGKKIRFRVAFGSVSNASYDGIAFDDFAVQDSVPFTSPFTQAYSSSSPHQVSSSSSLVVSTVNQTFVSIVWIIFLQLIFVG